MTIQEILEAHYVTTTRENRVWCKACGHLTEEPLFNGEETYLLGVAHQAEVLDKHMQEREAEAVRETGRNIERLYPRKGLINRADLLADIEIAADRLGRGIHANGRDKRPANGR